MFLGTEVVADVPLHQKQLLQHFLHHTPILSSSSALQDRLRLCEASSSNS